MFSVAGNKCRGESILFSGLRVYPKPAEVTRVLVVSIWRKILVIDMFASWHVCEGCQSAAQEFSALFGRL